MCFWQGALQLVDVGCIEDTGLTDHSGLHPAERFGDPGTSGRCRGGG